MQQRVTVAHADAFASAVMLTSLVLRPL